MREQKIVEEKKVPGLWDDTDRRIMRALADELSEVTVSRDLLERTLANARKQKETNRKKTKGYRILGGMLAAAAVLAVAVGVWGGARGGKKMEGMLQGTSSGNAANSVEMTEGSENGKFWDLNHAGSDNVFGDVGAVEDRFSGDGGCDNVGLAEDGFPGKAGCDGTGLAEDGFPGNSEGDGSNYADNFPPEQEPQEKPDTKWLYLELLALFDEEGLGVKVEGELPKDAAVAEEEAVRRISWQEEGREISCVVYPKDHRVVATLLEGDRMRRLELDGWVYADTLWELAGHGE